MVWVWRACLLLRLLPEQRCPGPRISQIHATSTFPRQVCNRICRCWGTSSARIADIRSSASSRAGIQVRGWGRYSVPTAAMSISTLIGGDACCAGADCSWVATGSRQQAPGVNSGLLRAGVPFSLQRWSGEILRPAVYWLSRRFFWLQVQRNRSASIAQPFSALQ